MKRSFIALLIAATASSSALAQGSVPHRNIRHALPAQQQAQPPAPPQNITVQPSAPAVTVQPAVPAITVQPAAPAQVTVAAPKPSSGFLNIGEAFGEVAKPYINAAVDALLLAVVTWACALLQKWTGKVLDEKDRNALALGLRNQAASLIADGAVTFKDGKIAVDSAKLERAGADLLKRLPDVQKRFGLTPEFVQQRAIDTIPQIEAGAQLLLAHARGLILPTRESPAAPPAPPAPAPLTTGA